MENYYIEIVGSENGEVVKVLGPMSERKAQLCDQGTNRNLDHENYYTRIVEK